jgi:ribosome biogenesis GTPase
MARPAGDEGTIEKVEPRRNLFYRQDEIRTKSFAANLDQVLVLIAADPEFSEHQLTRALIAAEAERIAPADRAEQERPGRTVRARLGRLLPYQQMGYGVLPLSLRLSGTSTATSCWSTCAARRRWCWGPSGAGKSTLINLLVPRRRRRPARSRRRSTPASTPRPAPPGTGWTPSAPRR